MINESDSPRAKALALALILLAVAIRVFYMIEGHSLWLDELRLAVNVVSRNWWELFTPLDYGQGAPPLFLLSLKLSSLCFGPSDFALLLPVYLVSLLLVPLFYGVARRILPTTAALFALLLFVLNPQVFTYSFFLKQYVFDVMFVLVVLWLIPKRIEGGDLRVEGWQWIVWLAVGVLVPWFSHPSVFALAGLGGVCGLRWAWMGRWRDLVRLTGVVSLWLVSFSAQYLLVLNDLQSDEMLADYWDLGMFDWSRGFSGCLDWLSVMGHSIVHVATLNKALATGLLLGAIYQSVRRPQLGIAVLWSILLVGILASFGGFYPLYDRLSLFIVPVVILLVASGYELLLNLLKKHSASWVCYVVTGLLCLSASARLTHELDHPGRFQELKEAFEFVVADGSLDATVWVAGDAQIALEFYGQSTGIARWEPEMINLPEIEQFILLLEDTEAPVVLIFGRPYKHGTAAEYQAFFARLRALGYDFEIFDFLRAHVLIVR
ncbi:glycosyltransferase family 39 protein [Coraliomargarita sp. W4R72]